jgi:hypothetical protein
MKLLALMIKGRQEKENDCGHYMTDGNSSVEFRQHCAAMMHKASRSPGASRTQNRVAKH